MSLGEIFGCAGNDSRGGVTVWGRVPAFARNREVQSR